MISYAHLLLRRTTMVHCHRNLSFQQLKDIQPILTRKFAWFSKSTIKQSFGKSKRNSNKLIDDRFLGARLKRRLRNLLIVTFVGFGSYYAYRSYRNYVWFRNMSDSDQTIGTKPRVVVLGTGNDLIDWMRMKISFRLGCCATFKTYQYGQI